MNTRKQGDSSAPLLLRLASYEEGVLPTVCPDHFVNCDGSAAFEGCVEPDLKVITVRCANGDWVLALSRLRAYGNDFTLIVGYCCIGCFVITHCFYGLWSGIARPEGICQGGDFSVIIVNEDDVPMSHDRPNVCTANKLDGKRKNTTLTEPLEQFRSTRHKNIVTRNNTTAETTVTWIH